MKIAKIKYDKNNHEIIIKLMVIKIWNESIRAAMKVASIERHNSEMIDEMRKLLKDEE